MGEDGHDFLKNVALHFHALELGAQALDFGALRAAGHGLLKCLALLALQHGRRNTLGAGHVSLRGTGCYLPDALGYEREPISLAGGGQAAKIQVLGYEQQKLRLRAVHFS